MSRVDRMLSDYNKDKEDLHNKYLDMVSKAINNIFFHILKVDPNDDTFEIYDRKYEIFIRIYIDLTSYERSNLFSLLNFDLDSLGVYIDVKENGDKVIRDIRFFGKRMETIDDFEYDNLDLDTRMEFCKYLYDNVSKLVSKYEKIKITKKINKKNIIDFKSFLK